MSPWTVVILGLATAAVGCRGPGGAVAPELASLTSIVVSIEPDGVSTGPGGQQQFVLIIHSESVDTVHTKEQGVYWEAPTGLIDSDGFYLAPDTTGTFLIFGGYHGFTDTATILIESPVPTGMRINPDSVELETGQYQEFSIVMWGRNGVAIVDSVDWRAIGGSIDSSGRFSTTDYVGDFLVIASHASGLADTAWGTITRPVRDSISLFPSHAVLFPGDTLRFAVEIGGEEFSLQDLKWTATGGALADDGAYVAGEEPGLYQVIVSLSSGDSTASDTASVKIVPSEIESLTIVGDTMVVLVGHNLQLSAVCWDTRGRAGPCDVEWSVTGGSVNLEGLFSAGEIAGRFSVVAQNVETELSDSAVVLVEPGSTAVLVIEPRAVVLEPSDTVVFDVQVEDAFGNAVGVEVEWAATGGPVTAEGVYTAGREAGTFRVVASYAGLRDTALIEVGAARVTTVSIVPEQVTMEPLGVAQLSAIALDKHGVVVNEPVTWAVTGGTIDAAGMYRASLTREAILVLATHVSGVTDTASVTVTAPSNWLYPGDDLQAAVDAHAAGTEFLIKTGIHRLQRILPKAGNTFMGEPGAILSGARELTTFSREGSYWTVSGQSQAGARAGVCDSELQNADGSVYTGCQYPEDLFIDDEALFQVTTLGEVQSGTWFFDYVADKVYFADDPTGRRIEISETRTAFDYAADNVTIRDLIVEKYANPAQHGAIHAMSPDNRGVGWVIEANEVRLNHGTGIKVGLTNARISGNNIHHNGQLGIGLLGVGNIVEENTVAFNNTAAYSAFWEAGGTKFARTTDLVVRGNVVHDNIGPGLWTDIDNLNTLYEDNVVRFNAGEGIFHEISYDAIIRNNVVEGNGFAAAGWLYGAGILVAHSPNVEVYGNTVLNNANGIASIQQDRGSGVHGPHITANLWVHDNSVTMTAGVTGLAQDVGDDAIFDARNNRFDRNTYYLGPLPKYFAFANGARTIAEWQAFGHDVNGVFPR